MRLPQLDNLAEIFFYFINLFMFFPLEQSMLKTMFRAPATHVEFFLF
jgi:hypothetical protein